MLMLTATLFGLWCINAILKDIDDDDDMGPGMMVPATAQP
ncbi:hypothetical protein Np050604_212 [Cyanophage S-RIM44]|uniref:Uncharacterized protein n=3 Tax=Vellamovirus TaxID=2733139 RepID=A0A127KNC4_9CAUD|nr:hypothetical protein Syn1_215 [Prochlorococcus phage Syn1]YP_009783348.1 hypothetical protein HOQ83_gp055 [Cyanophage S-RIM44]ADO99311.1 hypothetical protein Syn1_215 [Prochlorococcus phage Syn1]AMO43451.1 hypothetical protein W270710_212 [Cyanophage S-RIM44]AOO11692.1 hypothetical protein ES420910_215 [Cyanophage S-RIM44]AOO11923.1 hypothetical protein Np050604_212 [Cyanophage S-RIM44]AOO12158.1 hypothetical protein Np200711_216 [Cyanophage S-RIM44]